MQSVFNFENYQSYLKAYIKSLPKNGYGEAKRLAAYLKISSTFVSQIISGQRMLTLEQAEQLIAYFGFSTLETEYFFYLVQLERAGSIGLKKYLAKKIALIKKQSEEIINRIEVKKTLSENEKTIFYSTALYSCIHLYTSTSLNGYSIDELAQRFELSRNKTADIVRFLAAANLLQERNGKYSMTSQSTHLESTSPHLLKHHSNWHIKAIEAAERLSEKELMYTAQVSLSKDDFSILREEMVKFIRSFLDKVHSSPAEEIANLNIDWFWIK